MARKEEHHKSAEKHLIKSKSHAQKAAKFHDLAIEALSKIGKVEKELKTHVKKDKKMYAKIKKNK